MIDTPEQKQEFKEIKIANQGRRMSEMNVREIAAAKEKF